MYFSFVLRLFSLCVQHVIAIFICTVCGYFNVFILSSNTVQSSLEHRLERITNEFEQELVFFSFPLLGKEKTDAFDLPISLPTKMEPKQEELDSMLDDALAEYAKQQQTASTQQKTEGPKQGPGKTFAPKESDIENTVEVLMKALAAAEAGNKNETECAAAGVQAAADAASAPMAAAGGADLSAEREADEFLRNFLANVAKEGTEASSDDGAAVAGLLGPFVSKEMLYPPLREIRERVCFFPFIPKNTHRNRQLASRGT